MYQNTVEFLYIEVLMNLHNHYIVFIITELFLYVLKKNILLFKSKKKIQNVKIFHLNILLNCI